MEIGRIVGEKIKSYRKRVGKTQLQFAMDTYMSPSYISRFERGLVTNPTQATLAHIATSIGVSLDQLITDHSEARPIESFANVNNMSDYQVYLNLKKQFDLLPEKRRHQLWIVLETLLELRED